MEEWKDYHGYKVSNKGRVVNRFGREIFGEMRKSKGYEYHSIVLRINKKRTRKNINVLVCELFNSDYKKGARVYQIDGDKKNCAIDNLKISRAYTAKPNAQQVEKYTNSVMNCVKHYFKNRGWIEAQKYGIDIDNALGNAYVLIWKYLPSYKEDKSFYSFCAKYCRFAFLYQYKQDMNFFKSKKL